MVHSFVNCTSETFNFTSWTYIQKKIELNSTDQQMYMLSDLNVHSKQVFGIHLKTELNITTLDTWLIIHYYL